MKISLVVAAAENNAIGKNNQLLWRLPNDMKFFKNLTWGLSVVMGRKTFESIGSKPLPGRFNIVLTKNPAQYAGTENVFAVSSIENAIAAAEQKGHKEVFIIGGSEIYQQSLNLVDRIYLTRVHESFPDADTFFSPVDETKFKLTDKQVMPSDEKHVFSYCFETWDRKD